VLLFDRLSQWASASRNQSVKRNVSLDLRKTRTDVKFANAMCHAFREGSVCFRVSTDIRKAQMVVGFANAWNLRTSAQ